MSPMGAVTVSIILIFLFVIVAFAMASGTHEMTQRVKKSLDAEYIYHSVFDKNTLAISFINQQIHIGKKEETRPYAFREIIKVDLIQDNNVVTSTDRGSQIVGGLVGGLALGGLGMLAGSLSAQKNSKSFVSLLALRIIVSGATYRVIFYQNSTDSHAGMLKQVTSEIETYYGLLLDAMSKADLPPPIRPASSPIAVLTTPVADPTTNYITEMKAEPVLSPPAPPKSAVEDVKPEQVFRYKPETHKGAVIDDAPVYTEDRIEKLKKLWALLQDGVISEEEYEELTKRF